MSLASLVYIGLDRTDDFCLILMQVRFEKFLISDFCVPSWFCVDFTSPLCVNAEKWTPFILWLRDINVRLSDRGGVPNNSSPLSASRASNLKTSLTPCSFSTTAALACNLMRRRVPNSFLLKLKMKRVAAFWTCWSGCTVQWTLSIVQSHALHNFGQLVSFILSYKVCESCRHM